MKNTKYLKSVVILLSLAVSAAVFLTACSSLSKVSYDDACNWGYYTGKSIRSMIDN